MSLGFVVIAELLAGTVNERRREIGIRVALGARPLQIVTLVSRSSISITLVGGVAGLTIAVFAVRLLRPVLYGVTGLGTPEILATGGLVRDRLDDFQDPSRASYHR